MEELPPVLADLLTVCRREVGAKRTSVLAVRAGLAASEFPETRGPEPDFYRLWWALWLELARERPDAFLPHGRRLRGCTPDTLAFAYARRSETSALIPLRLTADEHRTLSRCRRALCELTGLAGLRRGRRVWTFTDQSLALRHLVSALGIEACAIALIDPQISAVLLNYRYVAQAREPAVGVQWHLPLVLLHEELHLAAAAAATVPAEPNSSVLAEALEEPAAVLAELYAEHWLETGQTPSREDLHTLSYGHPDGRRARIIIDAAPSGMNGGEIVRLAVALALLALQSSDDKGIAGGLAALLKVSRSGAQWTRRLRPDPKPYM